MIQHLGLDITNASTRKSGREMRYDQQRNCLKRQKVRKKPRGCAIQETHVLKEAITATFLSAKIQRVEEPVLQ